MDLSDPTCNSAYQMALRRLSRKEFSKNEMEVYLQRKGVSEDLIGGIVELLLEERLIDDRRYLGILTREYVRREKGPIAILAALRRKGVELDLTEAEALFVEISGKEPREVAHELIKRRYPRAHEDKKEFFRAYQALLRRGFSKAIALESLKVTDQL